MQDITERKQVEEALAGISRQLIEAQEQERGRIARELHDDIGQRLSLLIVELDQLQKNSRDLSAQTRSSAGALKQKASEIVSDIQSLSHKLHSSKLQYLGITAAVRGFCREFGEQQNVEIDVNAHDLPSRLSPDIALCLFRVLQEALHNSAKHSGVRHFGVRLWLSSDEVHLAVSDSGAGFDIKTVMKGRGLGLTSMRERVRLVSGTIVIESKPAAGTTIHVCVPFKSEHSSARAAG
jgi:signal transduction histidine kinase